MGALVRAGGLRRRSGWGTGICDLDALSKTCWTVGIAGLVAPDSGPVAFYGALLHRLLSRLARAGCRCNTYFRSEQAHWPHRLSDFPGLEEDAEGGVIDALLAITSLDLRQCRALERRGLPVCHTGFWEEMPHATIVDTSAMLRDAADLLAARGTRRLAVLNPDPARLLATVRDQPVAGRAGVPPLLRTGEALVALPSQGAGSAVVRQLLARPPSRRPGALVCTDDFTALEVTQVLAGQSGYRPLVAVMTTRQLPIPFALPVIRFELDLDELADRGVEKVQRLLLNPTLNGGVEFVAVRAVAGAGESWISESAATPRAGG
jgi:DNA-binding LacI/PurR family transcriptional regulator